MSPLVRAEAAMKDKAFAKKKAVEVVEKKQAVAAVKKPKPHSKEVERKVAEKVMDPPPVVVPFKADDPKPAPATPVEDQLYLIRRRGIITLARHRHGEFYSSHAGFYSELVDKPDAWIALPEF